MWLGYTKNVIFFWCNPNTSFGVHPVCLIILTETNCSPLNSRWRPISLTERFFDDCQKRIAVWAPSRLLRFFPCFHFFHLQTTISPWQGWVESDEQGKPLFYTVSIFPQCAQVSADGSSNPQLELGNQQDSFESTSLSCFSPSFSLFLLSNCELDYDSLYGLLAAASICNLSLEKIFACNSRYLWIPPQLFIWLFGFIVILHE